MNNRKILPPTYLLFALLAMIALHFVLPITKVIPSPWNMIGVIFLLVGIDVALIAEGLFRRYKTTVRPFEVSSVLVTDGLYRISRNPMYLGFMLALIGVAILLGSLTPMLVIPIFLVLIEMNFIRTEERMLAEKFGQDWLDYTTRVGRWI